MYTLMLLGGLFLWFAAHFFKRLAPGARAKLGNPGKGLIALLILGGLVLIVMGYRNTELGSVQVWFPPTWTIHINNLLMLLTLWVYGSSAAKGAKAWPAYKIRHPQLTAVKIWAFAHLIVNGDLASIILFGGILAWAVISVILINKAEPEWMAPEKASEKTYVRLLIITLVLFSLISGVHSWLGYWPFPGTPG